MTNTANRGGKSVGGVARSSVEEEYIRNLQQQVYLLELETRFMRNNVTDDPPMGSGGGASAITRGLGGAGQPPDSIRQGTMPLNDAIKGLKYKYVELQEKHKQDLKKLEDKLEHYKTENHLQALNIQNIERDREELKSELKGIRDHHASEKDKLYGELIAMRKKQEISASDYARLEKTHQRLASEKQQLKSTTAHAEDDARKYRDQVEELLHINATLKVRVEELHKEVNILQARAEDNEANNYPKDLENLRTRIEELKSENMAMIVDVQQAETRAKQEEHLRQRISVDCEELIKCNVHLKSEVEDMQKRMKKELESREQKVRRRQEQIKDAEETREELAKIRDEMTLHKIAMDNKERKLQDYKSQVSSMENALNSALETRNVLEERIAELESRANSQESELIQIGQDKSLLIDDVAELRNTSEIKAMRLQQLIKENQDLKVQLDKFSREMSARKEFSHLITAIESSGENYMHLMRNMRSYLGRKHEDGPSIADEIDEVIANENVGSGSGGASGQGSHSRQRGAGDDESDTDDVRQRPSLYSHSHQHHHHQSKESHLAGGRRKSVERSRSRATQERRGSRGRDGRDRSKDSRCSSTYSGSRRDNSSSDE